MLCTDLDPIGLDAKKGSKVLSRGHKGLELGIGRIGSIRIFVYIQVNLDLEHLEQNRLSKSFF